MNKRKYQPSKRKRARKVGFMNRNSTSNGKKILVRRIRAKRKQICNK